jgi:hypothetical protein
VERRTELGRYIINSSRRGDESCSIDTHNVHCFSDTEFEAEVIESFWQWPPGLILVEVVRHIEPCPLKPVA